MMMEDVLESCPEDRNILLNLLNTKDVVIKDIEGPMKRMNIAELMNGMTHVQNFVRGLKDCSGNVFSIDTMWSRNKCKGTKKSDLGLYYSIFLWPKDMEGSGAKRMDRSKARNWFFNEEIANRHTANFAILDNTVKKILKGEVVLPPECVGQPLVLLNHSRVKLFLSGKKRKKYKLKKAKPTKKPKPKKPTKKSMAEYWIAYWRKIEKEEKEKRLKEIERCKSILLKDKYVNCPCCNTSIFLNKNLTTGSSIACPNARCDTSITVSFVPSPSSEVYL